jgi:nitric oxide reductase NorE protein
LICGDLTVFAVLFGTFVFYRGGDVELYQASQQHLNRDFGVLNTALLLTSSWLAAGAVQAFRDRSCELASRLYGAALLGGLGFVAVKAVEYSQKITAGITPISNDFYMFYFILTGIHLVHVLIGLAVLAWLRVRARRPWTKPTEVAVIEGGTVFWHLVDLLWIVLFALLYLLR